MYVDLNIPWPTSHLAYLLQTTASTRKGKQKAGNHGTGGGGNTATLDIWRGVSREERERMRETVDCAIRLGYSVVAFNLIIPQSLDPLLLLPHFPFNGDAPPFPELDPRTADPTHDTKTVLQLSRLTMVMDEQVAGSGKGVFGFSKSQAGYLGRYSLLAAMPLDAASFAHACLSLSSPSPTGIDVISLELGSSPKLAFHMPLSTVSNALKHGVLMEAIYSPATSREGLQAYSPMGFPVQTTSAPNARRNLVSVLKEMIRVTNCAKGLVVSSGARRWAELRSAGDVINLLNVLGLSHEHGRNALTTNPKSLVSRALSTRQTLKGVISNPLILAADSSPSVPAKRPPPADPPLPRPDAAHDSELKRPKT